MKEMKYIFWDMDGVLFPFNPNATNEQLHSRAYYEEMKPVTPRWIELREMEKDPWKEQYVLSAVLCKEAKDGKNAILDRMGFPKERRIFVPCDSEHGKAFYAELKIGRPIDRLWYLLDDHTPNCIRWQNAGGTAIKVLNSINGKGGTWNGLRLSREGEILPAELMSDAAVDDLVFEIYNQALKDLRILAGGKQKIYGENEERIRRWMMKSNFGVDGEKILAAYDLVAAR